MCGIAGILKFADAGQRVSNMMAAMRHRGPDGQGVHAWNGGAIGMVRLALVDLSDRGLQPMWSPDGKVAIVFNGEMYNHAEHRERLRGRYAFRSTSDTEVALALYYEDPTRFVERMRGMFALAIVDWRGRAEGAEPTVVLARDPFGIKPLYLARPKGPDGPVVFASELRALLASGLVPPTLSRAGLRDYLSLGFAVQPNTLIEGVEMLECGVVVTKHPGKAPRRLRYWSLPPATDAGLSFEDTAVKLRSELEESVRLHALADAPVGAFLSGGIDSSAITTLMAQHNPKLRTYTLKLVDGAFDESAIAKVFAQRLGCEHTEVEVREAELPDLVAKFASEIDQPSTDGLNTWLVSRAAARDVKGVLSGLGGDEWFSGYPVVGRMARRAQTSGGRVLGRLAAAARWTTLSTGRLDQLRTWESSLTLWYGSRTVFAPPQLAALLGDAPPRADELLAPALGRIAPIEAPIDLATRLDSRIYMQCQLLRDSDATSMASSLELRVPFVDTTIAARARSCPAPYKRDPNAHPSAKRVLIKALDGLLPAELLERPKRGFAIPHAAWLAGPLEQLERSMHPFDALVNRGWLERRPMPLIMNPHPQRWALLILELWARSVLDAAPAQRPAATPPASAVSSPAAAAAAAPRLA